MVDTLDNAAASLGMGNREVDFSRRFAQSPFPPRGHFTPRTFRPRSFQHRMFHTWMFRPQISIGVGGEVLAFLNLKFAMSDLPIRIIMLAMKLRKIFVSCNLLRIKETIEFSVPVEYARCQM